MSNVLRFAAALVVAVPLGLAQAQQYPNKPVRVIAPAAAGTNPDVLARVVFQNVGEVLGQQFVIDNRPGAGGVVAAQAAAKMAPDGYSLFLSDSGPIAISPALQSKAGYDPLRDFVPITGLVRAPLVLVAHPGVPAKTLADLVNHAKSKPGLLRYGTFGVGSVHHLTTEMFSAAAGIKMVNVPFRSGSDFLTALLNGDIELAFFGAPPTLPHIKQEKLRALAVTSASRSVVLPDVPSIAEQGYPSYNVAASIGLMAPTGTPREVIETLAGAVQKALANPDIRKRLTDLGMVPIGPEERYDAINKAEIGMFGKAIKDAGIKIE